MVIYYLFILLKIYITFQSTNKDKINQFLPMFPLINSFWRCKYLEILKKASCIVNLGIDDSPVTNIGEKWTSNMIWKTYHLMDEFHWKKKTLLLRGHLVVLEFWLTSYVQLTSFHSVWFIFRFSSFEKNIYFYPF